MSCFLSGRIEFKDPSEPDDKVTMTRTLKKCAEATGLHIEIGTTIRQPLVYELLGEGYSSAKRLNLPFLITADAASDTSDDLISPFQAALPKPQFLQKLEMNLTRVQLILSEALLHKNVSRVLVVISEGYDVLHEPERIPVAAFTQTCAGKFSLSLGVPTIHLALHTQ